MILLPLADTESNALLLLLLLLFVVDWRIKTTSNNEASQGDGTVEVEVASARSCWAQRSSSFSGDFSSTTAAWMCILSEIVRLIDCNQSIIDFGKSILSIGQSINMSIELLLLEIDCQTDVDFDQSIIDFGQIMLD